MGQRRVLGRQPPPSSSPPPFGPGPHSLDLPGRGSAVARHKTLPAHPLPSHPPGGTPSHPPPPPASPTTSGAPPRRGRLPPPFGDGGGGVLFIAPGGAEHTSSPGAFSHKIRDAADGAECSPDHRLDWRGAGRSRLHPRVFGAPPTHPGGGRGGGVPAPVSSAVASPAGRQRLPRGSLLRRAQSLGGTPKFGLMMGGRYYDEEGVSPEKLFNYNGPRGNY